MNKTMTKALQSFRKYAERVLQAIKRFFRKVEDLVLQIAPWLAAGLTIGVFVFLVGHILINGIPFITPSLFSLEYNSDNVSLLPAFITTIIMVFLSLLIAAPLGLFTAIYLVEYAQRGNRLVRMVRITVETLSGIPSIVYGLFGSLFFVGWLGWGYSVLAGTFTLSIMILPLYSAVYEFFGCFSSHTLHFHHSVYPIFFISSSYHIGCSLRRRRSSSPTVIRLTILLYRVCKCWIIQIRGTYAQFRICIRLPQIQRHYGGWR